MFHRADGESSENIPEAYETSDNEAGVGFDGERIAAGGLL
jgi:hypothetical protein